MKRDLDGIASRSYDVLVVGGGIHGAWAAWDATLRGLKVGLIDRGDFGAETSANNLRVIHGGLRYLQHLDLPRMRESIREQGTLLRVAPHLVHPMPCLVPTYGRGMQGKLAMRCALAANDVVGLRRNRGLEPGQRLLRGRILPASEVRSIIPGVPDRGLTGGAVWYDAQVVSPERLVLSLLRAAVGRGATVANYLAAERLLVERDRVRGVEACDVVTDRRVFLRADVVVNFAGPWADALLASAFGGRELPRLFPHTQAWNLVLRRRLIDDFAAGLYSLRVFTDADRRIARKQRLMFFVPWRDATIVGTSHRPYDAERGPDFDLDDPAEIADLLEDVSAAYPDANVTGADVAYAFGGLLPGEVDPTTGHVRLAKHPRIRDHAVADGIPGLVSGVGVKFTTARYVAEKAIDRAVMQRGRGPASTTATTPVDGGDIVDWPAFVRGAMADQPAEIDPEAFRRLLENRGTGYRDVLRIGADHHHYLKPLAPGCPVLAAEIAYAARHEAAMTLEDIVRRRTDLGVRGRPDDAALERAAAIAADELGWSEPRTAQEIADVKRHYARFESP